VSAANQRTKRRLQRAETRRAILDAAGEFLEERSFRELSVEALMSRTGLTRTLFYRHFDDVPSLVLALMEDVGGELMELAEAWTRSERVDAEEARRRLERFVDFYVRHGRLVHAVAAAANDDEIVERAYAALVESYVELTARTIEARIAAGELEPVDGPEVARALVWMLNGYLRDSFGRGERVAPDRALDAVWTIWSRSLFPGR
jgi:TetR/AcrR family transcriptional regulator, ethionamide resistance regulator